MNVQLGGGWGWGGAHVCGHVSEMRSYDVPMFAKHNLPKE